MIHCLQFVLYAFCVLLSAFCFQLRNLKWTSIYWYSVTVGNEGRKGLNEPPFRLPTGSWATSLQGLLRASPVPPRTVNLNLTRTYKVNPRTYSPKLQRCTQKTSLALREVSTWTTRFRIKGLAPVLKDLKFGVYISCFSVWRIGSTLGLGSRIQDLGLVFRGLGMGLGAFTFWV